ncbi:hypothetical protein HYC85_031483 [Camellia sinensis]|uniref:Uncharacterized protein n=1 Tax=Camellia sinensis TaxID=4442 RepID=A0A7J7FQP1_CAMSI|nr:hypothetical protein HYC85_031483 [Camellia sinensis]
MKLMLKLQHGSRGKSSYWNRGKYKNQVQNSSKHFSTSMLASQKRINFHNSLLVSYDPMFTILCRNCIIDKNARIGKNVVIANSKVSFSK